jgi:hypothetical protein
MALEMTPSDVRVIIRSFICGTTKEWDWDDFISTPIRSPYLNAIRIICRDIPQMFPPETGSRFYCSDKGWEALELIEKHFFG